MGKSTTVTVTYMGGYDPLYTRVRTVLKALKKSNINVIECQSRVRPRIARLIILAFKYLKSAHKTNLIMISEAGHFYVPLAKILSLLTHKPLIFDCFLSHYHVNVVDAKRYPPSSYKAKLFYLLDKIACTLADVVLLDTPEHIEYFSKTFNIPKSKFRYLPVGSDDELFYPELNGNNHHAKFLVFLVSSFYPLHGVDTVIRAAKLLEPYKDIKFLIVGNGLTHPAVERLAISLNVCNVTFKNIVPSYILPELMTKADICLGQFGDTEHTHLVVPAKVYDAIAMKKAVISGNSNAVQACFLDAINIALCPLGNPEALAESILTLKNNHELRQKIGENAYILFKEKFSLERLSSILSSIIQETMHQA